MHRINIYTNNCILFFFDTRKSIESSISSPRQIKVIHRNRSPTFFQLAPQKRVITEAGAHTWERRYLLRGNNAKFQYVNGIYSSRLLEFLQLRGIIVIISRRTRFRDAFVYPYFTRPGPVIASPAMEPPPFQRNRSKRNGVCHDFFAFVLN